MANKTSLEKEIAQAEDRILPKDGGDSLQKRIDDFATRYHEGEEDERLDKYSVVFEKMEQTPQHPADTDDLEHQAAKKQCKVAEPLKSESSAFNGPLEDFAYSEVKPGWVERVETGPDGSTIRHVSIDLTKIDPEEPDELDRPAWDWQPGPRPPSYRGVERMIKDGY